VVRGCFLVSSPRYSGGVFDSSGLFCLLLQLVALAITAFVFCFLFRLVLGSSGRCDLVPAYVTLFDNPLSGFYWIWDLFLKFCSSVRRFVGCIPRSGYNKSLCLSDVARKVRRNF